MPPYDVETEDKNQMPLRLLLYGPPKTKKTWWAGKAAEAGFNVILLDCDDGAHILVNIEPEYRARITHINIVDKMQLPVASVFLTYLLAGKTFVWDEQDKRIIPGPKAQNLEHSYYKCNANLLTPNDLLVIDSWTLLSQSIAWRWYQQNNVKVEDAEQAKQSNWDGYRWSGALADWMLKQIKALNCHVAVIGHQTNYEKMKTEEVNGRKVQTVEWSRMQPISTSGPRGMAMGQNFSDILYFTANFAAFKIDTSRETSREGGCRSIPPGSYKWDNLQFKDVCKYANIRTPESFEEYQNQSAFEWCPTDYEFPENWFGDKPSTGGTITTAKSQPGILTFKSLMNKTKEEAANE